MTVRLCRGPRGVWLMGGRRILVGSVWSSNRMRAAAMSVYSRRFLRLQASTHVRSPTPHVFPNTASNTSTKWSGTNTSPIARWTLTASKISPGSPKKPKRGPRISELAVLTR